MQLDLLGTTHHRYHFTSRQAYPRLASGKPRRPTASGHQAISVIIFQSMHH